MMELGPPEGLPAPTLRSPSPRVLIQRLPGTREFASLTNSQGDFRKVSELAGWSRTRVRQEDRQSDKLCDEVRAALSQGKGCAAGS